MPRLREVDEATQDKINVQMHKAVHNFMGHARRSLLDFVDLERTRHPGVGHDKFWEMFKKRLHNDIAMLESQMLAAYEIAINGGIIPPFGRTEQELQVKAEKNGRL